MNTKLLTKKHYIALIFKRFSFLRNFYNKFVNRRYVGNFIILNIMFDRFGFYMTTAIKANYLKLGFLLSPDDAFEVFCVGIERKFFSSTMRVRFIDSGVLVERKLHFFSPFFYSLKYITRSKSSHSRPSKAKLYYFTVPVLKKYLNVHYYS